MDWSAKQFAYGAMTLSCILHGGAKACSVADIKIKRAEVIVQNRVTYIIGNVSNECPDETGVQIHITLRDDKGRVVLTDDFWPARMRNIPPRSSFEFTYVLSPGEPIAERRASSIQVDIVALRKW